MRDENRIKPFLKEVEKIWKKAPDLRFGQMMENLRSSRKRRTGNDLYYYEDDDFLKILRQWMDNNS